MPRALTCALLVVSDAGWLIVRATRSNRWDFPKGLAEPGETPLQAALRECREETGLDWSARAADAQDLGRHPYLPGKDLHLFRLRVPGVPPLDACRCTSMVEAPGRRPFPEVDAFAWAPPDQARPRLGKSLRALLASIGV
ncbi:NUDIX hydrolase [Pigmentiphaga soli]|uniref:NUDIX hydrolase n=1 Tax=Pigmentiphaga soli TaxID=1007095 RepID=A0ABP8HCG5_9BURK